MADIGLIFTIAGIGIGAGVVEQIFESRGDMRLANFVKLGSTIVILWIVVSSIQDLFSGLRTMLNL